MLHKTLPVLVLLAGLTAGVPPAQAQQEKFSLSMFHFNVQYVAGGLVGFPDGETFADMDLDYKGLSNAGTWFLGPTKS